MCKLAILLAASLLFALPALGQQLLIEKEPYRVYLLGSNCEAPVTVRIVASDPHVMGTASPELSSLLSNVQAILSFECPDATEYSYQGFDHDIRVFNLRASASENWRPTPVSSQSDDEVTILRRYPTNLTYEGGRAADYRVQEDNDEFADFYRAIESRLGFESEPVYYDLNSAYRDTAITSENTYTSRDFNARLASGAHRTPLWGSGTRITRIVPGSMFDRLNIQAGDYLSFSVDETLSGGTRSNDNAGEGVAFSETVSIKLFVGRHSGGNRILDLAFDVPRNLLIRNARTNDPRPSFDAGTVYLTNGTRAGSSAFSNIVYPDSKYRHVLQPFAEGDPGRYLFFKVVQGSSNYDETRLVEIAFPDVARAFSDVCAGSLSSSALTYTPEYQAYVGESVIPGVITTRYYETIIGRPMQIEREHYAAFESGLRSFPQVLIDSFRLASTDTPIVGFGFSMLAGAGELSSAARRFLAANDCNTTGRRFMNTLSDYLQGKRPPITDSNYPRRIRTYESGAIEEWIAYVPADVTLRLERPYISHVLEFYDETDQPGGIYNTTNPQKFGRLRSASVSTYQLQGVQNRRQDEFYKSLEFISARDELNRKDFMLLHCVYYPNSERFYYFDDPAGLRPETISALSSLIGPRTDRCPSTSP